jgi:hypothetical protein
MIARNLAATILMVVAIVGCGPTSWGPLAVIDEDADLVLASGGFPGRLRIGDRCVSIQLEEVPRELTLVWRDSQVTWDATARRIEFVDTRAGEIGLRDGDRIAPGGAGLADPDDPDQGAPQPMWIVRPDPSCPSEMFVVHSVRLLDQ